MTLVGKELTGTMYIGVAQSLICILQMLKIANFIFNIEESYCVAQLSIYMQNSYRAYISLVVGTPQSYWFL